MKIIKQETLGQNGYYEVRLRWRKTERDIVYWNGSNVKINGSQQFLFKDDVAEIFYRIKLGDD